MMNNRRFVLWLVALFLMPLFKCSDDPEIVVPDLSMLTNSYDEGGADGKIELTMKLSERVNNEVEFEYSMEDITAIDGEDYIAKSGTITFNPSVTQTILEIDVNLDFNIELRESFRITFISPQKPEKPYPFEIFINNDDYYYDISEDSEGFITPDEYSSMELVWSDEFDGPGLDLDNWTYEIGDGCDKGICGWGNEELEDYTDSENNVFIENGKLVIRATLTESCGCYKSGRIISDNKQEFQYGRIDIRAKLPEGQGIWPALWMLGTNIDDVGWPACGEIDIMEYLGHEPWLTHATVHYDNNGYKSSTGTYSLQSNNSSFKDKFHVFSILWDRNEITWYVDYQEFKNVTKDQLGEGYPFNKPQYFIMNVAVGGLWPGYPDETTEFPQQMEIDYIRVFQ